MKDKDKKQKIPVESSQPPDEKMSLRGKSFDEMLPYLLSGEPDDLSVKKKK